MLVVPEHREKGLGHQLMTYCEEQVLTNQDFCFAYQHLESFYGQHGFQLVEPQQLPNSLKNLFERYSQTKSWFLCNICLSNQAGTVKRLLY